MEPIDHCILCGTDSSEIVLEGPDRLCDLPGKFRMVRCQGCGLLFQNPQLSEKELACYYPRDYLPFQRAIDEERWFWRRWDRRYRLWKLRNLVHRYCPKPGQMLDYGCATGLFLDSMKRLGKWNVRGVEPDPYASNYARQRFGLEICPGTADVASFAPNSFDVITLWDVLEHCRQPVLLLQNLALWLKPGGHLFCSIPNVDSWERYFFRRYWIGWDLPRHLYLFPQNSLIHILDQCGFSIRKKGVYSGRYHTFLASLDLVIKDHWHSLPRARKGILELLRAWPFRLAALGLYSAIDRIFPSTCITFIAQRGVLPPIKKNGESC